MAVIDTSWSLTGNDDYDCIRCDFNKEASTNGKHYCNKTGLMLPNNRKDCPLKSVDDYQPVIHAKWIRHYAKFGEGGDHRECSNCGVWLIWDMSQNSYCPNCGAKMDKEQNNE